MIKLTELCGVKGESTNPIWIFADVVVRDNGAGAAQIKIPNVPGWTTVTESPEEITRKILEYKLAMVRYGAEYAAVLQKDLESKFWEDMAGISEFYRLAGLEE